MLGVRGSLFRPPRTTWQASFQLRQPAASNLHLHPLREPQVLKYSHFSVSARGKNRSQGGGNTESTPLNASQLAEIYAGKFPSDYEEDVIHLRNIPSRDIKDISKAFEENEEENRKAKVFLKHNTTFTTAAFFRSPGRIYGAITEGIRRSFSTSSLLDNPRFNLGSFALPQEFVDALTVPPKLPDLILDYGKTLSDLPKALFIAEVGIAETYGDLLRSMKLWLKGNPETKLVFLVKVEEEPEYKAPKTLSKDLIDILNQPVNVLQEKDFFGMLEERDGQIFAHGSRFVGSITAFFEVWVRDSETGKPVRKGERIEFYDSKEPDKPKPEDLFIKFTDFCPVEEVGDARATLKWEAFDMKLKRAQRMVALGRCMNAVMNRLRNTSQRE
ncbi:hypothetical protein FQN54_008923 [Arachnomyces sp. PD_36]|nr:hypothetical protein FQN54_008923 [Arachnomyces sp. PD_36]